MDIAFKLFQKLLQKTAKMTTFVEQRFASLLSKLGRYEEAAEHFINVIERKDDISFFSFGNVDKPLVDVYLRGEIEAHGGSIIMPEKVLTVYELISTYVKMNETEEAEKVALVLDSLTKLTMTDSLTEKNLVDRQMAGYAYMLIGNKEKAAEIFVSVLEKIPGHPPVTAALESCRM
jgi:tetratricopeptide (TPR) repeat protein